MLLQKKDDKNIFIVPARSKAYKRTHTHTHTHTHKRPEEEQVVLLYRTGALFDSTMTRLKSLMLAVLFVL